MNILVIDGQGGKIGRCLIEEIKEKLGDAVTITAVGTNSIATAGMVKAGADYGATGENATIVACRKSEVILGPIGIVIADALLGEVTPAMATAISQSCARRILIPFQGCNTIVVGTECNSLTNLIHKATDEVVKLAQNK